MVNSLVKRILTSPTHVEEPLKSDPRIHRARLAFQVGQRYWMDRTALLLTDQVPATPYPHFCSIIERTHCRDGIQFEMDECEAAVAGNLGLIDPRRLR